MAALTVERAKELAKMGGFVRLPRIDGAPHKSSGQVISVVNERTVEVKPWGHGKTEMVPLSGLSEHKSKTAKHQEIAMQRRIPEVDTKAGVSLPYAIAASAGHSHLAMGSIPPKREPFVVIDPTSKQVWGGPEGANRGFHKSIEKAATFSDAASAARSAGKLRHATQWKSQVNVDALIPLLRSDAAKQLAKNDSPPDAEPSTSEPPPPVEPMIAAPVKPASPPNSHHDSLVSQVVESKPTVPPAPEKSSDVNVMQLIGSMAEDYKNYEIALAMAEDAQKIIMEKMAKIQAHMSGNITAIKTNTSVK